MIFYSDGYTLYGYGDGDETGSFLGDGTGSGYGCRPGDGFGYGFYGGVCGHYDGGGSGFGSTGSPNGDGKR